MPPLHGRTYTADEDQPGRAQVVVLSHRFWQRRFGGDASIVGRQLRMNGEQYDVIGIMPPRFDEISTTTEVYVPIAFTAERLAMHDEHYLQVYACASRTRRSHRWTETCLVSRRRSNATFRAMRQRSGSPRRDMRDFITEDYRLRLYVLLAAVTLVLVIACVNVANLLIARLAARSRELAIRAAIGAGRGRIVRQVLTESLVLASVGGVAGLLFAWWALPVLIANAPEGIPRLETAATESDGHRCRVRTRSGEHGSRRPAAGVASDPARDLRDELGDGKGATGSPLKPWIRQTLIAAQAALVLIVLAGAALLVRSAINLQHTPAWLRSVRRAQRPCGASGGAISQRRSSQDGVSAAPDGVAASPLVDAASLDSQTPLVGGGGGSNGLVPEGRPLDIRSIVQSRSHFISPDYFKVLGIPLRAGRAFTPQDVRSAPLVMIVNERLAREAFRRCRSHRQAHYLLRRRTRRAGLEDHRRRRRRCPRAGPAQPPSPEFYLPVAQIPDVAWSWVQNAMNIVARRRPVIPAAAAPVIRSAVRNLDRTLPVYRVSTLDDGFQQTMAEARFNTVLDGAAWRDRAWCWRRSASTA